MKNVLFNILFAVTMFSAGLTSTAIWYEIKANDREFIISEACWALEETDGNIAHYECMRSAGYSKF